jgi:hypothetical protein
MPALDPAIVELFGDDLAPETILVSPEEKAEALADLEKLERHSYHDGKIKAEIKAAFRDFVAAARAVPAGVAAKDFPPAVARRLTAAAAALEKLEVEHPRPRLRALILDDDPPTPTPNNLEPPTTPTPTPATRIRTRPPAVIAAATTTTTPAPIATTTPRIRTRPAPTTTSIPAPITDTPEVQAAIAAFKVKAPTPTFRHRTPPRITKPAKGKVLSDRHKRNISRGLETSSAKVGRPPTGPKIREQVRARRAAGATFKQISQEFNIGVATVDRILRSAP